MKFNFLMGAVLIIALIGFCHAETYTAESGYFAYQEVQNYTLNGYNFTMLDSFEIVDENSTHMYFKNANETLNISVVDNGTVLKVNSTGNATASETMFGSVEGYFVDRNGTYSFSFEDSGKLVSVSSGDMAMMIDVIGNG